ncbi:MAG: pyrroline-5-carboxylate reductase [Candidatus Omnitrophota bacterium]|jgi:pyrroline-5-carboxylate reductase
MITKKIGIIGCGNMGEALLSRLSMIIEKSTSIMVTETDEARREYIEDKYKVIVGLDNNYLVKYSDVVIIAVKPKDVGTLLKDELCCSLEPKKLAISIAAGITIKDIEKVIGKDVPVIRAMPNMPALVGEGMTAISRGTAVSDEDVKSAKEILSVIGDVVLVDESLMDSVTAISGSGPAYFFYLAESMIEAAEELGLDKDLARKLVFKTALGSAKLLSCVGEDPAVLRAKVTSKGGTTEEAIKVFESKKLRGIIIEAAKKARDRSKELSKG